MASESRLAAAQTLERLLPKAVGALFPHVLDDPLSQLPVGQLRLLRTLSDGPCTMSVVASRMGISMSGLTQLSNRLVASGLAMKRDDPDDRRVKWLQLTDRASLLMALRAERRAGSAAKALERLSDEQISRLLQLLETVATAEKDAAAA